MKVHRSRPAWQRTLATFTLALAALGLLQAEDQVVISEFMAANTRSLTDRDREHSDWIELHNPGANAANLDGWFLTDDRANLKKWRFPSVTIGPNEYLVVFASKKDRRLPGGELHTNFKLDAASGYLALVRPDGTRLATEFAPNYPRQVANASYGLDMTDRSVLLVGPSAPQRWLVPNRDLGKSWPAADFDDTSWQQGTNPLGFPAADTASVSKATELKSQMLGRNGSVYMRIPFQIADPSLETLRLRMNYSDGFVAYLNGWEIARRNAPEKPQWNSTATASRNIQTELALDEKFEQATGNYVTAQFDPLTRPRVTKPATADADGYLRLINGRMSNQVAGIAFPQLGKGTFESLQADFAFRWRGTGEGTERLVFLLIPVSAYGASGNGVDLTSFQELKDPKFAGVLAVQLLHSLENGQKALTVHWDRTRRTTVNLANGSFGPRAFHHAQIRLRFSDNNALMDVTLTANAESAGKQVFQPVSHLVIPGLRPFNARAQFLGRIGHWDQTIDLDDIRIACVPTGAGSVEEFELVGNLNVLRAGKNVLSVHGLNQSAQDETFLVQPELIGSRSSLQAKEGRYFALSTPRAGNREGLPGLSPAPQFSRRGGVFTNTATVELSVPQGTIRYTVDGSEPSATSPAYTQPIALNSTTLVRARNFVIGLLPSGTVTETFTCLDENAVNFTSNLPLLILNPFGQYISANSRAAVSVRFIDTVNGRSSLAGAVDFDGRASVNVRGFSTLRQPKNSLTIRIKDENDDKIKVPLLGMPKESDWVLYAPYSDKTMMRDVLAYELCNKMGRYAPRTRFVEVFLDRSGGKLAQRDYMGVYVLIEKIKRGKNRVNITEMFGSDVTEPAISGGYIFKRDHSERYETSFHTSRGSHYYYVDPSAEELSREQMTWLRNYMNRFEQALYGSDFRDPNRGYAAYLDADAFIDQHWLIEMSKNIDGFRYSAFLFKDRGGKLQAGPPWDWNLSFGNADYHDGSDPSGWYTPLLRESEICWFRRLNEDPDFEQRAVDRWGELRRTIFAPAAIHRRIDEMAAQLNEAQARNYRRWPILGRRVNPNDFVGSSYGEEIQWMKQWIQKRIAWIDNQFVAPPALTRGQTGAVTLRASSGKILYTVDGSDPRLPGGSVSPRAVAYSNPISLRSGAKLFARVQHRNNWSSPMVLAPEQAARAGN